MPVYTLTTTESTLASNTKAQLAGEVARIHSAINHVPNTYVNVIFHELAANCVYTGGVEAAPVLVNGWVRDGHPAEDTTHLATKIAAAVTRIAAVPAERVTVVLQSSPARFAVEAGRLLPDPGHEADWLAAEGG